MHIIVHVHVGNVGNIVSSLIEGRHTMATAVAKDANGRAVAARVRAEVLDKWDDGIVVRVKISPELVGHMIRGNVEELIISSVGPNTRELRVIE